jgi:hypothetical protein
MKRRDFLKASAAAAIGTPLIANAWQKPSISSPMEDTWFNEPWRDVYNPKEFICVKPAVHILGTNTLGIWWKTNDIAAGWVDASQDGGKTYRRYWLEVDGVRSTNTCTHVAVIDDYDSSKPLKFRAVSRPIAEFGRFGQVRYKGEEIPGVNLKAYKVGINAYNKFNRERINKYTGEEHIYEGEVAAIDSNEYNVVMFNNIHHSLALYPELLKYAPKSVALAVFAGDIVDFSRSDADLDKHLSAPMAYVCKHLKCLSCFTRGPREFMGPYAQFVRKHIAYSDNPFYRAFSIGATRFALLDSAIPTLSEDPMQLDKYATKSYLKRERRWLEREVASREWKESANRVAFAHIPPCKEKEFMPFGNSGYQNIITNLYEVVEKDLSLLMAGHLGNGRYYKRGVFAPFPVVVGGGPKKTRGPKVSNIATLSVLSVKGDSLEVYQIGFDGKENFRERIG